jgi:hypothetical protein
LISATLSEAHTTNEHWGQLSVGGVSVSDQFEQLRLGDLDSHATIWRYFTFPKFISLLLTRALWFSKLSILADALEGMTTELTRAQMKSRHRDMEEWFPDQERKQQVRRFVEVNEEDGRELIVANCWFIGEHESQQMWDDYVRNDEGVAIRSTAECLANSLCLSHECWWMGKVNYVDLARYDRMNVYEGHQAHLWAFLKSEKYAFENELRVATMNWVAPGCLNPDGSPQTEKQKSGLVYSPDRRGVLVSARLPVLMEEVRTAPGTSEWHHNLIDLLLKNARIPCPVVRSEHENP